MNIRAIVAEDELVARQSICAMSRAYDLEVVAECKDGDEAIESLQRYRADLLFLDVQMPGTDGFGVLQRMRAETLPGIIFTTAHDRYAVRAFEHHAVDYLLKPFDEERFRRAVDRFRVQFEKGTNRTDLVGRLLAELNQARLDQARRDRNGPERIAVRSKGQVAFLRVHEIDWIEASHNQVKIHIGRDVHLLRQAITEVEARLQPDRFLRIHRSLIVNVDRIRRLEACGYGEYLVVLHDGKKLSLSRGYRDRLDRFVNGMPAFGDSGSSLRASFLPPE
jgi:two-component system, LytTR family, response regulator